MKGQGSVAATDLGTRSSDLLGRIAKIGRPEALGTVLACASQDAGDYYELPHNPEVTGSNPVPATSGNALLDTS